MKSSSFLNLTRRPNNQTFESDQHVDQFIDPHRPFWVSPFCCGCCASFPHPFSSLRPSKRPWRAPSRRLHRSNWRPVVSNAVRPRLKGPAFRFAPERPDLSASFRCRFPEISRFHIKFGVIKKKTWDVMWKFLPDRWSDRNPLDWLLLAGRRPTAISQRWGLWWRGEQLWSSPECPLTTWNRARRPDWIVFYFLFSWKIVFPYQVNKDSGDGLPSLGSIIA